MSSERAAHRSAQRLVEEAARANDLVGLWRCAGPLLAEAVPHFEAPCFFTVDPASLLPTSHFQEGLPEIPAEWLGREYAEPDYNSMSDVLLSRSGVGTLEEATGGRPELATKYHEEMQPYGCEQELLVALRTSDGQPWGLLGLYREVGRPRFSEVEQRLLTGVAGELAQGARRSLLMGQARDPDLPDAPGLLVFDGRLALESATGGADRWLAELDGDVDRIPVSILTVAGQVLSGAKETPMARVLSSGGRWLVVHGAPLTSRGGADGQVAVIIEAAQPHHLETLLMSVHGLTQRERQVMHHVLRGLSTKHISGTLEVAEGTVQAHLRSIFDKTGVRSRRELIANVFHQHYEPRVRDNEQRTLSARSSRGGPHPGKAPSEDADTMTP